MRRKLDKGMADLEKLSKWTRKTTMGHIGRKVFIAIIQLPISTLTRQALNFEPNLFYGFWCMVHVRSLSCGLHVKQHFISLKDGLVQLNGSCGCHWHPKVSSNDGQRYKDLIILGIRCCQCSHLDVGLSTGDQAIGEHVQ